MNIQEHIEEYEVVVRCGYVVTKVVQDLNSDINEKIRSNWQPRGEMHTISLHGGSICFSQVMVKLNAQSSGAV